MAAVSTGKPNNDAGARDDDLGQVVDMTRVMLGKARAGQWSQVMTMELERQERIQAIFADGIPAHERDRVAQDIREILDMDREMIALGRRGQDALSQQINDLQAGRRAQQAYSACGG